MGNAHTGEDSRTWILLREVDRSTDAIAIVRDSKLEVLHRGAVTAVDNDGFAV